MLLPTLQAQGTMSGNFKATLVANHVRQLTADAALGAFTAGASSQCTHRQLTHLITTTASIAGRCSCQTLSPEHHMAERRSGESG